MKKIDVFKRAFLSLMLVFAMVCTTFAQTTIASWNFDALTASPNTVNVIPASGGTGTLYLNGTNGSSLWTSTPTVQLNAFAGLNSTQSLALVANSANDSSAVFVFSTTGYENINFSFYTRWSGATAFSVHNWSYSIDGINFTALPSVTTAPTSTTFTQKTADLSLITAINNQATVYLKLTISGATASGGNNRIEDFVITGTAPGALTSASTPTITPASGVLYAATNVTIACTTPGATIYYTTDGTTPTQTSTVYSAPINVTTASTIKAIAYATGYNASNVATATYTFPVEVATIAAFKAANTATSTTVYKITGDVTFVYRTGRYIFVKDATGGLLIYDSSTPVVTNTYSNGDVISGGIYGTCTIYNGLYELIPTQNPAAGTSGSPVTPTVITVNQFLTNYATYESQLIKFVGVTFTAGTFGTGTAGNINISQGTDVTVCRNNFGNITGYTPNSAAPQNVTGFGIVFNGTYQIAPRDTNDIVIQPVTPTITTVPTVGIGTQNNALSTVSLTGGVAQYNGNNIAGTFTWTTPAQIMTTSGIQTFSVTFTPTNTTLYTTATTTVSVLVLNACVPALPWAYGFENGTDGTLISGCFTQDIASPTIYTGWTYNSTNTSYNRIPRTGSFNATLYYGNTRWLFKEVYLQPGLYNFSMYARQDMSDPSYANVTVKLGATNTVAAMDAGTTIIPQTSIINGDYQLFENSFTITTAGLYTIGIKGYINSTPWYISLDDILLEYITCPKPTSIVANNITTTTASLAITPLGSETSWVVEYKPAAASTWTVINTTSTTVNLTGLSHSTTYNIRVKAVCSPSDQSSYRENMFSTTCGINPVPFIEPFTTSNYSVCWSNVKIAGTATPGIFDIQSSGTYPTCSPKAGPYMARFNAYNIYNGGVADLSTPQLSGMVEGSLIKFWMYRDNGYSSSVEGIRVMVNDTASSLDATTILTIHRSRSLTPIVGADGWYQYIARVPAGTYNRVVFQGFSAYGNNIFLDEVEVTPPVYIPVTIVNGPNGTSSPTGTISVLNGTNRLINFNPAVGYRVASITVNGTQVQGSDLTNSRPFAYTLAVGLDTLTVNATYEKIPYTITPSITNYHGANYLDNGNMPGTITPNTPTIVLHGDATTFTVNVNNHFHLYKLLVDGVSAPYVAQGNNTFTYTFNNVTANHTIEAIVKIDTVAIVYNVTGGAGILDGTTVTGPATYSTWVNYGDDHLSTMPAAPGYENISTTVNGQYVGAATQYQLYDIMTAQTINVVYAPKTITVATQTYGNGTITDGVSFTYAPTYVYNYTVIPTIGNYITEILVNEVPVTIANPLNFTGSLTNITENTTIKAYFAPLTFGINATVGNGGTINPNGMSSYNYGVSQNYVINAETGYTIASVLVDNVPVTVPAGATTFTYTFTNITANHTIAVTFAINTYTITASAGANGTVTPAGATTVNYNDNQVYTIAPATGYHILDVLVDGISMGPIATYTFANVTANHTIAATFAINTYTITSAINGAGTISPAGIATVNYGANQTYTIAAAIGSVLVDVIVDGISQGPVATYTFTNVTADHNIQAITNTATFTVTVNQPANGAITPGTQVFNYGATPTFTITPNMGYSITAITVNSTPVTFTPNASGIATITLTPLAANATITATMAVKTYTITATAGANGTITPSGVATINYNTNSSAYIFTPNAGYEVADVTIDGFSLGAVSAFQFVNVTANHTINVNFQLIPCEAPINTYVTDITQTNAILNWNNTGATSYSVQYKNVADANYTLISNITTNNTELTGLTANTTYIWQVKANCTSTNSSDWSDEKSFVTNPVGPDGITDQDLATVQVYSNISNIFIVNKENVSVERADVFDMYGKLIYSTQITQNPTVITLDASTGIYVVRLSTENGTATYRVHITK